MSALNIFKENCSADKVHWITNSVSDTAPNNYVGSVCESSDVRADEAHWIANSIHGTA